MNNSEWKVMVKYRLGTEAFRRSSKRSWFEKVLILGHLTTDKFGRSVEVGIVVGVGGEVRSRSNSETSSLSEVD